MSSATVKARPFTDAAHVTGHHHHLLCRNCGKAVEVEAPAVETWAARTASEHGFTEVAHTVEIFGLCPECTAKKAAGKL